MGTTCPRSSGILCAGTPEPRGHAASPTPITVGLSMARPLGRKATTTLPGLCPSPALVPGTCTNIPCSIPTKQRGSWVLARYP